MGKIMPMAFEGTMLTSGMGMRDDDPLANQPFRLITLEIPWMGQLGVRVPTQYVWSWARPWHVLLYHKAYNTKLPKKIKYWMVRGHPWFIPMPIWFKSRCLYDAKKWIMPKRGFVVLGCPYPEWIRPAPEPPHLQIARENSRAELKRIREEVEKLGKA